MNPKRKKSRLALGHCRTNNRRGYWPVKLKMVSRSRRNKFLLFLQIENNLVKMSSVK